MEHRLSPRQRFDSTSAIVDFPVIGVGSVVIRDMSIGGVFVETDLLKSPPHALALVGFSLSRDGCRDDFLLSAMLVRRETDGVALMFLDMEDEAARALRRALFGLSRPRDIRPATSLWVSRSHLNALAIASVRKHLTDGVMP